jgi:hypothetical protein
MRTAKLKLLAAASVVVVGLAGTGAIVAVGQEKKPAEAGKPDPEWAWPKANRQQVPEGLRKEREEARARFEKSSKEAVQPTQFLDIKPLHSEDIKAFIDKRVPPVLDSDSPLRKLQKAKLRASLEELAYLVRFMDFGDNRRPFETTLSLIAQVAREVATTGVELADRPEDRRAWLEFRVGLEKGIEAVVVERVSTGIANPSEAWSARRHRLDAEIALLKHIEGQK